MDGLMADASESARINALESRVATLEAEIRNLGARTTRVEGKLDDQTDRIGKASERITELKERVSHLPSKEMIFKVALAIVGAIGVLVTFQRTIQVWLGVAPPH
jgi:uncharacterized coiled-coil protein SlyX